MKFLLINSLLVFSSQHYGSVNGQAPNPESFAGFALESSRVEFDGNLPESPDTCGLMCRGPDQYSFGLLSCLRTAFEQGGAMPKVSISETGTLDLPKVVFGPSTVLTTGEFNFNDYNNAREGYKSRLPAAILFAESTADVVAAVNCARVNGYTVSPRGRNHDSNSLATLDASLVIDMQLTCKMEDFEVDKTVSGEHILPGSKYIGKIKVPSGCTNAAFLAAVYKEFKDDGGMTVVGGCPSVGVTGYVLNGGFGYTTPYCGTASDMVDEFEMVLYDGTTITASATENEDIFWASKGGTGGIGVITHFWSRVVQNPSETKKFTVYDMTHLPWNDPSNADQREMQVDILMGWQKFYYDDPNSILAGGTGPSCYTQFNTTGWCKAEGVFLGSIDEFVEVLSNAQLLSDQSMQGDYGTPSLATRGGIDVCADGDKCGEIFGENFPKFGLTVHEFDSIAEAQIAIACNFLSTPGWAALDYSLGSPYLCSNIGIPAENCDPINLSILKCHTKIVTDALLKHAANPQSFLNRPRSPDLSLYESVVNSPNSKLFGLRVEKVGFGGGGLMLPKLQRSTFRNFFSTNDIWAIAHTVHGAPLKIDSTSTGYPHRKEAYLTVAAGRSPEWTNILLNDPAFNGDPTKLRVYGNYQPSERMPNYETHVYGDNAAELSRIRTQYDPLGGFDSQRYVQRNKQTVTSSARPSGIMNAVSSKASAVFLTVFAVVALI